jgi:acetolactate synthase-1/2/3 large subunit
MSNVAEKIAKFISNLEIDSVYIYPGGTIAPLVNAFAALGVKVEVFKHEQGALYAAMAKARITGKLQVAMVTSGPGVTNAITPLADAYYDSTPLLLITGQIGTGDLLAPRKVRQRGFQEVPTVSIVSGISKLALCPTTPEEALCQLPNLVKMALDGRMGPVVFDLPMDIQRAEIISQIITFESSNPDQSSKDNISEHMMSEVCEALANSKRPVLMLGHGALISGNFDKYLKFANAANLTVVSSILGLGSFDCDNKRFMGYVGHTGHRVANRSVHEADFLLVLGARLDVRQTGTLVNNFVPNGKIAWVNNDLSEIDFPRVRIDWSIHGDVSHFIDKLLLKSATFTAVRDEKWLESLREQRSLSEEDRFSDNSEQIPPKQVLIKLNQLMKGGKGFIVTGVGSHQQWAARHIDYGPDTWRLLTSAGHGAMGYDIPTALGAAMTSPHKTVVCIVGDGSFLMNIQELASIAERGLNIKILVLNNNRLGIVSQFQKITWGIDHGSGRFETPDFVSISNGFGIPAKRVEVKTELVDGMEWFWNSTGPLLLEVKIDHDAEVTPMLLGGQTMDNMWLGHGL